MSWTNRPVCSQDGRYVTRKNRGNRYTHTHTLTASCLETPKSCFQVQKCFNSHRSPPQPNDSETGKAESERDVHLFPSLCVTKKSRKLRFASSRRPSHNLRCDRGILPCALTHNTRQECFPAPLSALGTMATVSPSKRAFAKSLSDVSSSVRIY